jgi:hypothetical protein
MWPSRPSIKTLGHLPPRRGTPNATDRVCINIHEYTRLQAQNKQSCPALLSDLRVIGLSASTTMLGRQRDRCIPATIRAMPRTLAQSFACTIVLTCFAADVTQAAEKGG